MCVPILRSIGTKLTNLENMPISYVLFGVTQKRYVICHKSLPLHVQSVWLKKVIFMFLVTLYYICCHTK